MLKKFAIGASVCLALLGMAPYLASALTMAELQSSLTPEDVVYPTITITSATNQTVKITATPLYYNGNEWTYQLNWNRTRNALGSAYVSPRSNSYQKILSVDTADQAGSAIFTVAPSTSYRVEFYSMPGGHGTLLVRKFFTTRAAETVNANLSFGNTDAGTNLTAGTNIPVQSNPTASSGTNYSPLGGTTAVTAGGTTCDQSMMSFFSQPGAPANEDNVPVSVACTHIGQNWIGAIEYKMLDGNCYHTDWTGTRQISCTASLPTLPSGTIPNVYDSTFNWTAANAKCYHTAGDLIYGMYGATRSVACGSSHGTASLLPDQNQIISSPVTTQPNSNTTATDPLNLLKTSYLSNPTALDYLGTLVGASTVSKFSANCNQTLLSGSYGAIYNSSQPSNPTVDAACRTIGQSWIGSIDYSSGGVCYHADWTGTYKMDCAVLQKVTGAIPPALPNGQLPTNMYDSAYNWSAYNTKCYYTAGDLTPGIYGVPEPSVCGAYHGTSSLMPNQSQILNSTTNQANPYSTAMNQLGLLTQSYLYDPTAVDYLGALVGAGTVSSYPATCNQTQISQGYGAVYNSSQPANPPVDAACRTIGKTWVGSLDYSSSGTCYHADWTGTYKMDCAVLQKITGSVPPTLPGGSIPNAYDSTFNWTAANGKCFYTAGDMPSFGVNNYGIPAPVTCGMYRGTGPSVVSANDPTNTPSLAAGHSGAWVGSVDYKAADGKCYRSNWNGTSQISCTASLPALPSGTIPNVYDSTFNWTAANAKCYYTMNNPASENPLYSGVASNTWEIICGAYY